MHGVQLPWGTMTVSQVRVAGELGQEDRYD